jgi:hypothetical protein
MMHHQANLEPLNIFEFLLTIFFLKAADPCVSSGWLCVLVQLSFPAGVKSGSESCTKTEGHLLLTHGSAAFETKRTVSKYSEMFGGSKLA